jgi:hypothetical protein
VSAQIAYTFWLLHDGFTGMAMARRGELSEWLRNPIPFGGVRRRSAKLVPLAQNNRAGNGTEDDLFVPFRSG